ncbi:MAG TPA: tyrosine-type recombinase/integrase [Acidimicrobiales bacterium]|nr:tyrosine-type recombinase/integrase [Acidimicrobiales bacterium]
MSAPAAIGLHALSGPTDQLEQRYGADVWHSAELGVPSARGRATVSFNGIDPAWLRDAAKAWARQRLVLNYAFNTVCAAALAFRRFSAFLHRRRPAVEHPGQLDRALIEQYLAWLAQLALSEQTKMLSKVFLRALLEENRRYRWVGAIPLDAVIYHDELSARRASLPRFLPEPVMAQLESVVNLERLAPHYRHLVVVLAETGLRAGDACVLRFDPLISDSSGWPCLRFYAHKTRAEQLIPLSDKAVRAIRDQQALVEQTCPGGSSWLFPARSDPTLPQAYDTFRRAFIHWQRLIGLHDEAGRPTHAVPHQLRHSLGTRLINKGVPLPVVQRLLGHATPQMTNVYAHLHDTTVREELEHYWASRVDVEGRLLGFDPGAPTADAEWLKHNLARAADTLPNGYCGRPPQQDCPHPNTCGTQSSFFAPAA